MRPVGSLDCDLLAVLLEWLVMLAHAASVASDWGVRPSENYAGEVDSFAGCLPKVVIHFRAIAALCAGGVRRVDDTRLLRQGSSYIPVCCLRMNGPLL